MEEEEQRQQLNYMSVEHVGRMEVGMFELTLQTNAGPPQSPLPCPCPFLIARNSSSFVRRCEIFSAWLVEEDEP
jgi:hypothetical protein